jgi:hypothetical protein
MENIEINGCRHFFLKENELFKFSLVRDFDLKHPVGLVYKLKSVKDSPIRYVIQPNGTIMIFNIIEWCNNSNPYEHEAKKSSKQFGRGCNKRGSFAFVTYW